MTREYVVMAKMGAWSSPWVCERFTDRHDAIVTCERFNQELSQEQIKTGYYYSVDGIKWGIN